MQKWHGEKGTASEKIGPWTRLSEKPGEYRCSEGDYSRDRKTQRNKGPRQQTAAILEEKEFNRGRLWRMELRMAIMWEAEECSRRPCMRFSDGKSGNKSLELLVGYRK
jgi:hypothetical protein